MKMDMVIFNQKKVYLNFILRERSGIWGLCKSVQSAVSRSASLQSDLFSAIADRGLVILAKGRWVSNPCDLMSRAFTQ